MALKLPVTSDYLIHVPLFAVEPDFTVIYDSDAAVVCYLKLCANEPESSLIWRTRELVDLINR